MPPDQTRPDQGVIARATRFATAVATHAADGLRHATPEAQVARKAECESCPHLDRKADTCKLCGCHLALKRSWANQECPIGRWGAEPPT